MSKKVLTDSPKDKSLVSLSQQSKKNKEKKGWKPPCKTQINGCLVILLNLLLVEINCKQQQQPAAHPEVEGVTPSTSGQPGCIVGGNQLPNNCNRTDWDHSL